VAKSRPGLAFSLLLILPVVSNAADLKQATVRAWDAYIHAARMRAEDRARGQAPFLWVDAEADLTQRVRAGEVLVEPAKGQSPHAAPSGLIHDWMGTVFVRDARLDDVMDVLNDYDRYKDFYRPLVVNSKLLEKTPERDRVDLIMMQKAYSVTFAVETDDEVQVVRLDADRAYSFSNSVRVREIADYGKPGEHALPENRGPGYVWRTFTVTRLEQRDGGVYAEIEMIALSRSIPFAFRFLVQPLAERLPQKILMATLEDTREAVRRKMIATSLKAQNGGQLSRSINRMRRGGPSCASSTP
jgi:hypothetical protein